MDQVTEIPVKHGKQALPVDFTVLSVYATSMIERFETYNIPILEKDDIGEKWILVLFMR